MLTLALETSNPSNAAAVALGHIAPPAGDGGGGPEGARLFDPVPIDLLGVEPLHPVSRHEDDLLPAVARLCERCGVVPRQLEGVAVSVGPGGYTSLRMAVAAAKMIAEATGARVVSVPTATALARAMRAHLPPDGPFAIALAGKQDSAHLTLFAPDDSGSGPAPRPGRLIGAPDVADLAGAGVRILVADRHLPEPIRAAAEKAGIEVLEPRFDPVAVLECAGLAGRFGAREVDPVELLPLYGRDPEAVRLWKQRGAGG